MQCSRSQSGLSPSEKSVLRLLWLRVVPAMLAAALMPLTAIAADELVVAVPAPGASDSQEDRGIAVSGLFPIWENTAAVLADGHVFLGSHFVGAGLGNRVQVSLNPIRFAFRAPNVGLKVLAFRSPRLEVAVALEALWLLPGSSDSFTTSNFSTRLDTSDDLVVTVPLGVSATTWVAQRLSLSATATALMSADGESVGGWVGASVVAEWQPLTHHFVSVHLSEVGFWRHDFAQVGLSYRFHFKVLEARLGLAYQLRADGGHAVPSFSVGVEL